MITIKAKYLGELRNEAQHVRSGNQLITDAPVDNLGKGEAFSPTDLLATALGTCMMTIIAQAADAHGFNVTGTNIEITKIMTASPRKVGEVVIDLYFPDFDYSDKHKKLIDAAIKSCPVALSLHPDLKQTVTAHYTK